MSNKKYVDLVEKWEPYLNSSQFENKLTGDKLRTAAALMENHSNEFRPENAMAYKLKCNNKNLFEAKLQDFSRNKFLSEAAPTSSASGTLTTFDPILGPMIRRNAFLNIGFDVAGVQPMTNPTQQIFALKRYYGDPASGIEALFNEVDTDYSGDTANTTHAGDNPAVLNDAVAGSYTTGSGMSLADGEAAGGGESGDPVINEMSMEISQTSVTAKERISQVAYTRQLQQDLMASHGLNARNEFINLLGEAQMAETNREILRTIYITAKKGAQGGVSSTSGIIDMNTDTKGRWLGEQAKGLYFLIEREANVIARETRAGKGNILICSSDVASILAMQGVLDYSPALQNNLNVDDASGTFAGVLGGRMKVYIDPYITPGSSNKHLFVVGYKGDSNMDAGLFYCPYVAAQLMEVVGNDNYQPKIALASRYGLVKSPFVGSGGGTMTANENQYYRRVQVINL